jgi:ATP synthase in type III secretion protein N
MELLVQIGEYKAGTDARADEAIRSIEPIRRFLAQAPSTLHGFDDNVRLLTELTQ